MEHANRYFSLSHGSYEPSDSEKQWILYVMEQEYEPSRWNLPTDFLGYDNFTRALTRLEMGSSPGYPYQREKPTVGEWLRYDGVGFDTFAVARLWMDVCTVFEGSWDTVLRVFVKQEPHTTKKAQEKRWRLIMASPLCVQVAWHMLFDFHNDKEISCFNRIPSQQSISLPAGEWKRFLATWKTSGTLHGMDKSAWDWTAPFWALMLDVEFRYRMGRGTGMELWKEKANILFRQMFESVKIILSDGSMYKQVVPGIMKSGCVCTISTNGHCQGFAHVVACLKAGVGYQPMPPVVGDDTLIHPLHKCTVDYYACMGIVVKEVTDDIEFVGYKWSDGSLEPLYHGKHLKKLVHVSDDDLPDYLDSMCRQYARSRYYAFWEALCDALIGGTRLSRAAYEYWFNVGEP